MDFARFLFEVILISLSGVLMPGPVTAITIGRGTRHPHAGALVAIGHGLIEIPTMLAIFYGLGYLASATVVRTSVSVVGGILLLLMAVSMLRSITHVHAEKKTYHRSNLSAGLVLSAANPYFFLWWATAGAVLITRARGFGIRGFILFGFVHWLCDLVWYEFLSGVSFKGSRFFGNRFQKTAFGVCGALLVFFGITFIVDGIKGLIT